MKKVLCLIALIAATSVSAQPPDVPRSRHDGLVGSCGSCVPASDGVIHFRFSPGSGIVTETIGGNPTKRLNLIMQVRGSKKMTERPQLIDQVSAGINYNETTFGPRLYTPAWFNLFGTPVANAQCTATRSDFFTGGEASYVLVVTDDSSSILGLTEETTSITNNTASPSTFATLTDKFVDFITITCNVIDEETEADISFTAVAADATGVRLIDVSDANDPIFRRSILPVADNDLRGFRLDGKTWAEDYSRYSDGWGVRLKFSKGVYADNGGTKEALTAANFLLYSDSNSDSTTSTVSNVEHTADDPYVKITIADPANLGDPPPSPPAGAVIRLVSNATSTVKDTDDNELADGNFVASLEYDEDAPQVSSITKDSSFTTAQRSRWTIVFNKPIHADTAIKENLCITDRNGICAAADAAPTTPSIVSVIAGTADNIVTDGMVSTMTVVVNEGLGKTGAHSIEFRRNAILAGNLYIAEDYQTALRGAIQLEDKAGPTITLTAGEADPVNTNRFGEQYRMTFTVSADEPVKQIGDINSYTLMRVHRNNTVAAVPQTGVTFTSTENSSNPADDAAGRSASFTYTVTFRRNDAEDLNRIRVTQGFTLALKAGKLQDAANNRPVNANDEEIYDSSNALQRQGIIPPIPSNAAPSVMAARDTTAPVLVLGVTKHPDDSSISVGIHKALPDDDDPTVYKGGLTVSSRENIRDIHAPEAYQLLRIPTGGGAPIPMPDATISIVPTPEDGRFASVLFADADVGELSDLRRTRGFALAMAAGTDRPDGTRLRDYSQNNAVVINTQNQLSSVVLEIEKTAPVITVEAVDADGDGVFAEPTTTDSTGSGYTMTFVVTANEDVPTLNNTASYNLVGIDIDSNSTVTIVQSNVTATVAPGSNSTSATLTYTVTGITNPASLAGFTLVRNGAESLIDKSGNPAVRHDGTAIAVGDLIDDREAALAGIEIESEAPVITVRAVDIAGNFGTDDDGVHAEAIAPYDGSAYTMTFRVTANEDVPTLNNTASYNLAGIDIDDGTTVTIVAGATITPAADTAGSSRATTLTYTVTGITNPTDLAGFTLVRNGAASLVDESGNPPAAADGARIDSDNAAIAFRDRTPPRLTVTVYHESPKARPTADDGTAYRMTFRLAFDELIKVPNNTSERYSLASVSLSTPTMITNLNIEADNAQIVGGGDVYILPFSSVSGITDPTNIKGFTLVRSGDLMTDYSGNPAVRHDGTAIAVGKVIDDRAAALADRDTMPPSITVVASQFLRIDDQICGSFTVSGDEAIDGINSTASYSLLRINPADGTVAELTDAGGADAHCEGHGSVISSSTPTATTAVLNATIHFNVMDSEVTTAHKYTLGRKAKLTDTSGNPPVDPVDDSREITATADAAGRIDSRDAALGDIPPVDKTPPIITATVQDTDGDTSDMVEAIPDPNNPLRYSGSFRVVVQQPDGEEENVANIGETASYRVVYISITNNQESAIADQTITTSNVTANRAATVNFTAVLPNIAAVRDVAAFKLKPVDLVDSGANAPLNNQFTGTSEDMDTTEARRDRTAPQIEVRPVLVGGFGAVPNAGDPRSYAIAFAVRSVSGEPIRGLDSEANYNIRRILKDGSIGGYAPPTIPGTFDRGTVNTTLRFQVEFAGGRDAEIRDTAGFILIARTLNLTDYASNLLQGLNNVGDRIDTSDEAIALRDTQGPQITVIAGNDGNAAVDETNPLLYTGSFTVAAPDGKTITGLANPASYKLLRISLSDSPIDLTTATITLLGTENTTTQSAFSFTATLADITEVQDTKGFTLGYAANLQDPILKNRPVQSENGRLDSRADAVASIERPAPIITVRAVDIAGDIGTDDDGVFAEPRSFGDGSEYDMAFEVTASEVVPTLNNTASYNLAGISISDGNIVAIDQNNVTPVVDVASDSRATTLSYTVTGVSAPTSLAGFTLVRSGAASLVDESGNPPAAADGARIDGDDAAIAYRDRTPPSVTVEAQGSSPKFMLSADGTTYTVVFKVTPIEHLNVPGDLRGLYLLASVGLSSPTITNLNIRWRSANYTGNADPITFTYRGEVSSLPVLTDIKAFTLVKGDRALTDYSGNALVRHDDEPLNLGDLVDDREAALADRDTMPPSITVIPSQFIRIGDQICGSFSVSGDEAIDGINSTASYSLLRIGSDGATVEAAVTTAGPADARCEGHGSVISGSTPTATTAVLNATIHFNVVDSEVTTAHKYTLGRKAKLTDTSGNPPVDPVDKTREITATADAAGRIDSRDAALGDIPIPPVDTTPPIITVRAIDLSSAVGGIKNDGVFAEPAPFSEGSDYDLEFEVTASEAVPTLNNTASYHLAGVSITGNNIVTIDQNNVLSGLRAGHSTTKVTIQYAVASVSDPTNLAGFTLIRNGDESLIDESGNPPAVADGARIDSDPAAIAYRDRTPPSFTVEAQGSSPKFMLSADGTTYTVEFRLTPSEGLSSYSSKSYLLAAVGLSTPTITNLDIEYRDLNSDPTRPSSPVTMTYRGSVSSLPDLADIKAFTLVKGARAVKDESGNALVRHDGTEIAVGDRIDDRDAALADRDTDPPSITVAPSPFVRIDEDQICGSFTVSGADTGTNNNESIDGINSTASYSLLRIDPDGTVAELTTAGTANVRCTGQGSVISAATPVSTDEASFSSLLSATIHFNVVDVGVTTEHKYTLGRKERLTDIFGNPLVDTVDKTREITATADAAGRIDSRAAALGDIPILGADTTPPTITVRAIDIAGEAGTDDDGVFAEPVGALNGSEYTLAFRVAADKEVPSLNTTASYSLAGVSISGGSLVAIDQSNVTSNIGGDSRATTLNYTVTGISDPTSLAGFTLVRSGAESLVDESGNPPAAADGARIDSNDLAIAYRDRTPPRLTVSAMPATANASNSYSIRFTVTVNPNENVANLCALNPPPYLARGIDTNNDLYTLDFGIISRLTDSGTEGTSCRIQYNGVPALDRDVIRDTRGFVLVRSNANILIDNSGNPAVKSDGTAIVANQVIGDNAVSARDTTPPQITVTATDSTVSSSGDDINFAGTFTVTAGENILSIGSVDAYRLMRVLTSGDADVAIDATLSRDSGSVNSDMAVIRYSATLSGTSARSDTIATKGFTLARKNAVSDISNDLLDYASNIPVDPGDTSDPVNSANERLDSRDSAISPIDTSAPSITVTALDDEATPVRVSNTTNTYIMRFRINADKTVSDIGDPAAYTLMRIPSNGTTPLAITTTGVRAQPNIAVRVATTSTIILFTGQFTATQIADEQDTVGFTLGRATDADSGGNCRLCGIDKPTRGGGGSGTGDIEAGARIDKSSASVVARDTTSPQIQVLEFGDMTATEGISGISANGAFTVQFEVHEDAAEIPDINDQSREPYRILRKHNGSDDFSVVNSRQGGQAIATIGQCQDSSLTNIVNCWEITATELVLPIADALNTEHFTLGRAPDRLRDASNNDPIVADLLPETIVRASDADDPLPLDWDTDANYELEREKPSITVRPSPFARIDDDQVCGSFSVSGADTNGNEAIDGINSTASYSLLRIDPDGTVSELTTAGDANVRCTGHGSVISSAKPVSTSAIPFPSLLNATIYFNVVDSEVTTAHRYTLGRKESLTDISGNPLVDTLVKSREITATADAAGRIDSRDAALGDIPIPSTDMTLPKINATVQDIDDDTSDMVEAVPDANNPLSFSGRFRVEVQQPDVEEENVASIGEEASYQVVYISITNNQEVAISNQTITISNVTVNRAATVSFTAVLPNIAAVQDVAAFKLKPVDLVDSGGNAPLDNEFTDTNPAEDVDSRLARRERMPPQITITATNQAATADANDNYTMQFTVSANEAVATLGSASSYGVRRIDNDNNLRSDANATASNPEQVTANRQYTISYTANLSGLSATERRNTKGFTLVRVGTSRLIDRSGNPPVKADGSTAIANGAVIAAVTNNVVAATAVAARETARPRIEVRAVNVGGFGAVPHATLENTYEGSFTVRSVPAENIKGLGATASYTLQQVLVVGSNNTAQPTMEITSSSDSSATVSVTIGFQATFTGTQAEIDEAVRSTDGFTLSAGSLSLTDYASNLPQGISNVGDRLDTSDNAVAKVDRRAPRITVVAENDGNAVADETDPLVYTGSFTVTAPADKPITGLATTASYKVLRISLGDNLFDVDNATITPQGTGDETAAMFGFTAKLADITTVQKTKGFTLGYLANLRDSSGIIPQQFGGGRLDDREAAIARVSLVRVECAPFYPNIGQQDLFFKVTSESEPNLNGLTLTQGGTTLFNSTDTAVLMEGSEGEFAILKARVSSEITDSAPISVSYADGARTVQTSCAIDNLANLTDSDGDGVIDIVDSNPYDSSVTAINDTVASASLAATPASTDTFYNRRVLVRSLLRGNEFTYVEGGEIKMAGATALTAAEYFGIDYATKTHLLAVESDSDCALILAAAQENKLLQVNLAAFCASEDLGVAEEYDFVDKVSITERQRYVWVGVDSAGRLKPSEYPDHTISALPEINISGQSSYFYTEPPAMPKNIIISAYAPDATNTSITVTVKGTVVSGDPIGDGMVVLQRRAATDVPPVFVGPKVYSGIHPVTGSGKNPQAGQTIRHWLIGDTLAATINVWHATEAKLTLPTSGGYTIFDDAKYAIGDYSHVDVRMAKDGSSEPITEIHQLLLYDVTETTVSRVTSAVQGRDYYLIADLTTNIENIGDEVLVAMPQGGYTIRTTANQESFELIAFRVNSDAGDTISVGWDKIGTAENILASYRVTAEANKPTGYNEPGEADNRDNGDSDFDRIRNALDESQNWHFSLPVAVDNEIKANDWLGAVGWYDQPLYVSDEGLIIAFAEGDDMEIDYSAANIAYSGLKTDTRTQLGFTDDDSITSLATFGIRSVDYGFSQEANADAMVSGGIAYAVFPIEAGMPDQPLYISRYNEEAERWERFERGTHRDGYVDTWYVIDREMIDGESTYCPLDVGVYRNEHMTAGEDDMGFTANNQKCVLVAITDGGPYDNSGINGRIDALLAIGTQLQSPSQGLQCAAFYANVGQKELFFELNGIGFDANGFAIEQGGNLLDVDSALQINTDAMDGVDPIVKLTLSEEIVSLADIRVTYTADGEPSETMCVASLKEDTDDDGVADIVDNNPFDADDMKPNPDITGPPSDNDDLFVESDIFYSRDVVVRSLLRGEAFTYIEEDENDKPIRMTHTGTMTPAEYFGVDADARIYEYSEMCEAILATAQANGLSQVRLDEFCTEDISDDFVDVINNDFVEKGSDGHRYLWATVRDGFLVGSYIGEKVSILPEINFLGQDTYLFAGPTTKTVIISAYVSHVGAPTQISVKGASTDEDNDFSDSEEVTLMGTDKPKDKGTILGRYNITSDSKHPQSGETITRWLSALMGATNIWQPKSETLMTREGGHDNELSGYMYAIGSHNNIDVRVADPDDEDVTEIRQVLLYEVTDSDPPIRRVTSMVAGKTYYVAVDFDTNIADEEIEIEQAVQHMALYTITTATHHVARVRDAGHLEKEEVAIIVITVADDISTDTAVITVGWNKVGSVNNVISRYLVKNTDPLLDYALVDADLDGIPDDYDRHANDNHRLQISIGDDIESDRDFLATQDGNPTFLTYEGLVIADALNNDGGIKAINYSVVNNGDLSSDTQRLLGIKIDDTDKIDTIATFGVAGVEYGFELEGNRARPTGGEVYASFPIFVEPADEQIIYLGKYDYATGSWVRFERGTVVTWYAIDRPDVGACPTDVQVYQNQHQAVGSEDMGFTAGPTGNCIMLVLSDGDRLYDSSSLDGRVLDPLSIGTKLFDKAREQPSQPHRRGGGGAIGVSDILLLIGALLLITVASRKRRKAQ